MIKAKTIKEVMSIPMIDNMLIGLKLQGSNSPIHYYRSIFWGENYSDYLNNEVTDFKVFNNEIEWCCLITYK